MAIAQVFGTALAGRCQDRPELARAAAAARGAPGGAALPRRRGACCAGCSSRSATRSTAEAPRRSTSSSPSGATSRYFTVDAAAHGAASRDLLTHLYVLLPVLDDDKHYWVGDDEVEKLLRHGEGWLAAHPERELIARRYLRAPAQPDPARRWRRLVRGRAPPTRTAAGRATPSRRRRVEERRSA